MKTYQLPEFSIDGYINLLNHLIEAGYQFHTLDKIRDRTHEKIVYLRHDVDLHISLISEMAVVEKKLGIRATYLVPAALHFNPLYPPNQHILKQLCDMGHEIGLHYDMQSYPRDPEEARRHLDFETGIIARATGRPVRTISMHYPHKGHPDPFREIDEYVHPHNPRYQEDLLYVSDSCRAWRDESLLTCFGPNPPRRLLLLVHPELWLDASVGDCIKYLDGVLTENTLRQHRDYLDEMRTIWLNHPAPKLYNERRSQKSNS